MPIGEASEIVRIPGENSWGVLYIDEYAAARPLDPAPFEALKDRALRDWFEETRLVVDVEVVLNSEVTEWVNRQVRLSSVLLTPTPDPADSGQFQLDQFGQIVPAALP